MPAASQRKLFYYFTGFRVHNFLPGAYRNNLLSVQASGSEQLKPLWAPYLLAHVHSQQYFLDVQVCQKGLPSRRRVPWLEFGFKQD